MIWRRSFDEPRGGQEEFSRFDVASYTRKTFGMFGGDEKTVRLRFENRFVGVVLDRFGKDVQIWKDGESHFTVRVQVAVSTPFFGWLTGLGKGVRILSPDDVAEEYCLLLRELAEAYGEEEK